MSGSGFSLTRFDVDANPVEGAPLYRRFGLKQGVYVKAFRGGVEIEWVWTLTEARAVAEELREMVF